MKYCTQCGAGNADESAFCSQCGAKLESNGLGEESQGYSVPEIPPVPEIPRPESFGDLPESRPVTPEQPAYTPPQQTVYAQTVYSQSAPPAAPAVDKGNSVLWLILNIVLAVLCCCTVLGILGSICAIIGIVFAGMSISKANAGDAATARQYEKVAMILFFVALGVGIISMIVGVATNMMRFDDFNSYYDNFFDY